MKESHARQCTNRKSNHSVPSKLKLNRRPFLRWPSMMVQIVFLILAIQSPTELVSDAFQQPISYLSRQTCQFFHKPLINEHRKITWNINRKIYFTTNQHNSKYIITPSQRLMTGTTYHVNHHETLLVLGSELTPSEDNSLQTADDEKQDVPLPTDAGGYSHTTASKAKISAANKGKTPWNKGKQRSEEVKKRIAEGVRRRNREKFLQKLKDLGLTEEEYEQQKKEERRQKDAERRARKTANGGYKLTEETKQKISKILKEKHANGEIKKRAYKGPFRKGFTHSDETKQKIRESLKKKWAEDPEYQKKMRETSKNINSISSRQKISKTLKEKWQDPEFREKMLTAMRENKKKASSISISQRQKISEAMKKKWQNADYRKKALQGMEAYREALPPRPPKKKKITSKEAETIKLDDVFAVTPMGKGKKKKKKSKVTVSDGKAPTAKNPKRKRKKKSTVTLAKQADPQSQNPKSQKRKVAAKKIEFNNDGDISQMREERRDLYDLLYGDDTEATFSPIVPDPLSEQGKSSTAFLAGGSELDDENLDDFDPYGLENF